MKGEKLFTTYYEPGLIRQNIDNVVLRTYRHIKGFATDDPDNSTKIIYTPRVEVEKRIQDMFDIFGEDKGISITSIVGVDNREKYLFLLDCGIEVSDENERELMDVLENSLDDFPALKDGMILRTQNSYHVVGFVPLSHEEWIQHMGRAILLNIKNKEPISDIRYIGHSLERGYGSLRMSDYLGKPTPDVIGHIVKNK